jgi:hypothetical protein
MKKGLVFFILVMVVVGLCAAQSSDTGQRIVGTWTDIEGTTWVFRSDGRYVYEGENMNIGGKYSIFDGERKTEITLFDVPYSYLGTYVFADQVYSIEFSRDGKTLRLTGGKNLNGWRVAGPGWSSNQLTKK